MKAGLTSPGDQREIPIGRYTTRRFRAIDHDFAVQTTDPALGRHLDSLFEPFVTTGRPRSHYLFLDRGPDIENRYEVYYENECEFRTASAGIALDYLLWHVNTQVVRASSQYVLVHAAAAELNGQGILLPATPNSGKSTLVAGLVRAGLRYLTDEAVAIDPANVEIEPYHKPLSIEGGSCSILSELAPAFGPELEPYASSKWAVDVRTVRPDVLAPRTRPAFVVSPKYHVGTKTRLIPLRPAQTVMLLIEHSFNLALHGQVGLDLFAAIARQAPGFRLEVGDLDSACTLIFDLMKGEKSESHRRGPTHYWG
jgi:hypothetical protein